MNTIEFSTSGWELGKSQFIYSYQINKISCFLLFLYKYYNMYNTNFSSLQQNFVCSSDNMNATHTNTSIIECSVIETLCIILWMIREMHEAQNPCIPIQIKLSNGQ